MMSPIPLNPIPSHLIPPCSSPRTVNPLGQAPSLCILFTCSLESMVKDPAVGFMQATYWQL